MKSKIQTSIVFLITSILLSGLLVPLNIMFYSRYIFEPMYILDYIVLVLGFIIFIVLCHFLVKYQIFSFVIGWVTQIIANSLLSMVLSVNPEDISSSLKFDVNLFGYETTFAGITIPLILFLFSGLLILSSGFKFLYDNKDFQNNGLAENKRQNHCDGKFYFFILF